MLGIIVLNYNTWKESIDCISNLQNVLQNEVYKIYLIDNNSTKKPTDIQIKKIENFQNIKLIYSNVNNGYSAGNNIGLKEALSDKCHYILICNSDILIHDSSVQNMITFFKENKNAGVVGPQIYNVNDEFQSFYMLTRLTATGKLKNMLLKTPFKILFSNFKKTFILDHELEKPRKVFGVSGCCFMLSNECARFLYPLDERTFLYEEEYIIGARLEESCFDCFIIPNTHVIHAHGVSTGGMTPFSYQCLIESEQLYLKEYLHSNWFIRKLILLIRIFLKQNISK